MEPIQIILSDEEDDDRSDDYGWQAYLDDNYDDYAWQAYLDDLDVPSAPDSSSSFSSATPSGLHSFKGGGSSNYITSVGGGSSSSFFSSMRPATTTNAGSSNFNWRPSTLQASQSPAYRAPMRPYSANMLNNHRTSHHSYSSLNNNHVMHDHKGGIIRPPAQQSFLNGCSAPSNYYANPIRTPRHMISPSLLRMELPKERPKERKAALQERPRMMGKGLPKERQEALEESPRPPSPSPPKQKQEAPEERQDQNDERVIFQAALKDLNQPTGEIDPPKGALSVPLFRHQKMALAWMVDKEKGEGVCVGGILADDQGLGKTISMTALIQMQRSLQEEHKSGKDASAAKLEPFYLEDGEGEKVASAPAKLKPKVEYHGDREKISKRRRLILESAAGTSVVKPQAMILEDDEEKKTTPSVGPLELKRKVQSVEMEEMLRKIDSGYKPAAGTLVVCPASVLRQWAQELDEKVTEESKLSVLVYHGSKRTSDPVDLAKYDVVLTTYSLVAMEVPKQPLVGGGGDNKEKCVLFSTTKKWKKTSKKEKGKKGRYSDDSSCGTLAKVRWFRVILDEAHLIKNHRTKVARACCRLNAKSRWCLSGTPIQNEIDELYSYFRFLRHDLYSNYTKFDAGVKRSVAGDSERGYKRLRYVLKSIMLRRTKGTLIDGKPILNLPPKTTHLNRVDFSDEERAFYDTLERKYTRQFMAYAAEGTIFKNYAMICVMLLRLRQACDHPTLVINGSRHGRESLEIAKSLPAEKRQSLLGALENSSAICSVCSYQPQNAAVTTCGHVCCYQCGLDYLADDPTTCPEAGCEEEINADAFFTEEILHMCLSNDLDSDYSSSFGSSEEFFGLKNGSSSKIKAALQILQSCCKPSVPKPEINEVKHWNGCTLLENDFPGSQISKPTKAIVFSQWTGMLDLVEDKLRGTNLKYRRLDGSMSLLARDTAVKDFNTRPGVTVMLMSLKAGNLGLNMVAACHVILLDPWWNPTTEDQAVDRAHRIGQTRPVTVTRLTIANSIEDRILALQEKKRKMVSSVLGQDQGGGAGSRLSIEDLKSLFNVRREMTFHHRHDALEE